MNEKITGPSAPAIPKIASPIAPPKKNYTPANITELKYSI